MGLRVRRVGMVVLGMALTTALAPPVAAAPARAGTIIGGVFDTGPGQSCASAADCRAWLMSGCDPMLAGADPALHASIVDVSDLAGSSQARVIRVVRPTLQSLGVSQPAGPVLPAGVVVGGVRVQLWTSDCREVVKPEVLDANTVYFPRYIRTHSRPFPLPANVAWMTVAHDDSAHVRWELH